MELHPGVFVSSVLTDDWQPDAEVGAEMHVLVEEETAYCGMLRFMTRAGLEHWTLPERETLLVLEGSARIEIDGGPTLELTVGDMASLPKCGDHVAHDAALSGDLVLRSTLRADTGIAAPGRL